ncbi:hypothetical protein C5167_009720 [Papaver somniferum]|uniref:FBD domain-containing protein n=1 Tax=Papaver somniferum TaxID=3469 RepID=A0A4Y7JZN2_PAPSO|nr:uncharacterized protein LOC113285837 [Papaver somniferum]RZC66026.1 hypothetical protein C5167_009720 [Papaver somniferum]
MKLLGEVSTVKQMELTAGFLELLSQAPDLLDFQPPRLCNLQHLVLDMWSTRGCLQAISYVLRIYPNVSYLSLRCDMKSNSENVDDDWETGLSSRGMLSHLKYVQIERVEGCDAELKLLSFLLNNATDLEELSIYFISDEVTQVEQFKDKLRGVPTASLSIRLVFQTQF